MNAKKKRGVRHGSNRSYSVHGCRCDECCNAHNEAARKYGTNLRIGARADSKRRWDDAHRGTCACGKEIGRVAKRCVDCHNAAKRVVLDAKRRVIQDLWKSGATLAEIAAEIGATRETLGVEMHRMRADGWDMPYRYAMKGGKRVPGRPAA